MLFRKDIKGQSSNCFNLDTRILTLQIVLQECPVGTFKNVSGSDKSLCHNCPPHELPHRAIFIPVRGINYYFGFVTP